MILQPALQAERFRPPNVVLDYSLLVSTKDSPIDFEEHTSWAPLVQAGYYMLYIRHRQLDSCRKLEAVNRTDNFLSFLLIQEFGCYSPYFYFALFAPRTHFGYAVSRGSIAPCIAALGIGHFYPFPRGETAILSRCGNSHRCLYWQLSFSARQDTPSI